MTIELLALRAHLIPHLSSEDADAILRSLEPFPPSTQKKVSDIGLILSDVSIRAATAYFQTVPRVLKDILPDELAGWVGLGIRIAEHSSATAVRYFREDSLFSKIPDGQARAALIEWGLEIATRDPNRALLFVQNASVFFSEVTTDRDALNKWAGYGFALEDYTLAVEYFKATPALLKQFPMTLLSSWMDVAKAFAASKLFFAITFIRLSPAIFSKVFSFLETSHGQHLPSANPFTELVKSFLDKLQRLILIDPEAAQTLFRNTPQILGKVAPEAFLKWIDHGITLCKQGTGRGYFAFESQAAKTFADHLRGGLWLSSCAAVLKLLARGISGQSVDIQPVTPEGAPPTTDGQTIYLPSRIASFEEDADPFEWYKVATAFQAGYLEYGTFWPDPGKTRDLIRSRTGRILEVVSLSTFLEGFTNATLIKQLFDMTEGARVLFRLSEAYPGLKAAFPRHEPIPPAYSSKVVKLLHQIAWSGKTQEPIPEELDTIVFECCRILGAVQSVHADVLSSMRAAAAVYDLLVQSDIALDVIKPMEPFEETGDQVRGTGVEIGRVRPSVRGEIDPKRVEKNTKNIMLSVTEMKNVVEGDGVSKNVIKVEGRPDGGVSSSSKVEGDSTERQKTTETAYRYDEWDCGASAYRPGFCSVLEQDLQALVQEEVSSGEAFVDQVMAEYGGMIKSLRRGFQYLVPQGIAWVHGQYEGEALDLNRLVEDRVERRTKRSPQGRVYRDRRKKERSVAAAFLIDLSGSTEQRLAAGKTILQVEKEALLLLAQAIDAVGDRFALYGFSGRGNKDVTFYVLKDFDRPLTRRVSLCIGQMRALRQNRDGAAIRHATSKLAREAAKTRILVLLSDGKPLDDDYSGSYAFSDTHKALSEARTKGVHPFCMTVDSSGAEYLKGIYGEVSYMVVDKVEALPEKLPILYKRLTGRIALY